MDFILDQNPPTDYFLNLREFANGTFEAVLKVVRPLKREVIEASMAGALFNIPPAFSSSKELDEDQKEFERQKNHARAVRRAKQTIRWLCKSMQADRLLTLTYRENVEDRERVKANFKEFVRLVRKRMPEWQYVAVLEKQERGAYHVHCAVKGFQHHTYLLNCWHRALGFKETQTGADSPGNVNFTSNKPRFGKPSATWKSERLAGYITKYIQKTFDESATEKRRFWRSKDLSVPEKKRYWIGGSNIIEAIYKCREFLRFNNDLAYGADMWISDSEDCFWISGRKRDICDEN